VAKTDGPLRAVSGELEIHFFAAFWRERKKDSNLAWTKSMAMRRRESADKLCLSDTEIVADFEQGDKAILLP
jgi:hypothetical protein